MYTLLVLQGMKSLLDVRTEGGIRAIFAARLSNHAEQPKHYGLETLHTLNQIIWHREVNITG